MGVTAGIVEFADDRSLDPSHAGCAKFMLSEIASEVSQYLGLPSVGASLNRKFGSVGYWAKPLLVGRVELGQQQASTTMDKSWE